MGNPLNVVKVVSGHLGIGKGLAAEPAKPKQPVKAGIENKKAYPKMTQGEQLKKLDMDELKGKK